LKTASSPGAEASGRLANPAQPKTAAAEGGGNESPDLAASAGQTGNPPANPAAAAPAPLNLVIRASENSWISVTADGRTVLHELLIAPAHASVRAGREIMVKVGNAAGVTYVWNGQELPAQGAEAEVRTVVFDSSGMRVLPPAPPPEQNP
jgi:hypothetical protein